MKNEIGRAIDHTIGNGYIIFGLTASFGAGKKDICILKADSLGNKLWNKTFGGLDFDAGISIF